MGTRESHSKLGAPRLDPGDHYCEYFMPHFILSQANGAYEMLHKIFLRCYWLICQDSKGGEKETFTRQYQVFAQTSLALNYTDKPFSRLQFWCFLKGFLAIAQEKIILGPPELSIYG